MASPLIAKAESNAMITCITRSPERCAALVTQLTNARTTVTASSWEAFVEAQRHAPTRSDIIVLDALDTPAPNDVIMHLRQRWPTMTIVVVNVSSEPVAGVL